MSKPVINFTFPEAIWAGTNDSLAIAKDHHNAMMAGVYDRDVKASDEDVPYLYSLQGSTGVISIRGSLVNNDSPWNQYRGVTSYADIRRAMIYAASQPEAQSILLDIDSGGGAVSGVADTGDLITKVDKTLKPVYAFTDGTMASAAYWLGVSARKVYASKTAMTGSIGIIATLMEYSKAFKEAGIGVTVMRAGKFKALINSMEAPTEAALEKLQLQLDAAYKVFAEHVSARLGVSMEVFEASMGQGREFFGEAGVSAGLVKGLKTLDSMMSYIEAKNIDSIAKKGNTAGNYQPGNNMTRQALTDQSIAALAAGAPGAADPAAAAAAAAAAALAAADPAAVAAAAAAAEAAATAAATAAAATAAAAAAKVTQPANEHEVLVNYLKGEIKSKDEAFVAQTVTLNGLQAKLAGMEATHAGLVKIAAVSVSNMKVALGLGKVDLSAMSPELLLAEHAATATVFAEKFKVGGVAAVSSTSDQAAAPDHQVADLVKANRLPTRK